MSAPTIWSTLPKTVDDLTTIEEQIDADILTHNTDPSAHGQSGEAVEAHRSNDPLDHDEGVIQLINMFDHEFWGMSYWESLDGWSATAGVTSDFLTLLMQTGAVINTNRKIEAEAAGGADFIDWDKDMMFQTAVVLLYATSQVVYFAMGEPDGAEDLSCFGFKIVNGTLYAMHRTGDGGASTEYTTEIAGITVTDWHVYRAVYDADTPSIKYYVDGVLKHTQTDNLPTHDEVIVYKMMIENTAAANKVLYSRYVILSREI